MNNVTYIIAVFFYTYVRIANLAHNQAGFQYKTMCVYVRIRP